MKAAFTVWDKRIAPVCDVSRQALVLTVEGGVAVARATEEIEAPTPSQKVERLLELGVQTLVCGAISEPLQHELSIKQVRVIGFVAGELDEVVESFLAGELPNPAFSMPGCGRQRRYRGGRGGPRGGGCGRRGNHQ
jgi:predicted Fe-Mo cluster-binding NifX family protein